MHAEEFSATTVSTLIDPWHWTKAVCYICLLFQGMNISAYNAAVALLNALHSEDILSLPRFMKSPA